MGEAKKPCPGKGHGPPTFQNFHYIWWMIRLKLSVYWLLNIKFSHRIIIFDHDKWKKTMPFNPY